MSSTNLQMRKLRYKQAKSTARKELGQEYQTQIHVRKTQLFEPANQEGGGEMRLLQTVWKSSSIQECRHTYTQNNKPKRKQLSTGFYLPLHSQVYNMQMFKMIHLRRRRWLSY